MSRRMRPLRVDGRQVHQVGLPYHWGWRGLVAGDAANDLFPVVLDPNVHIQESKAATCDIRPGVGRDPPDRPGGDPAAQGAGQGARRAAMSAAPLPTPTFGGGYDGDGHVRMGFFTDTSVCIGCKACEVACKEWNLVPAEGPLALSGLSFDNTVSLGASTWRHVAFIEQDRPVQLPPEEPPGGGPTSRGQARDGMRWLMAS